MTAILERVEAKNSDKYDELAEKCRQTLGYTLPVAEKHDPAVLDAFAAVGIRPFSAESVEKYKSWKLWRMKAPMWARRAWAACAAIIVGSIVAGCALDKAFLFGLFSVVPGAIIAAYCLVEDGSRWEWESRSLSGYTGVVPRYAIDLAVSLHDELEKRKVYTFHFGVDELKFRRRTADPFLYLSIGPGANPPRYYLEVWDEPDFGAKRTV